MTELDASQIAASVWDRQSLWSQAADRLKTQLDRARAIALSLTVAAAILALAGSQLTRLNVWVGRALIFLAAAAAALAPIARRSTTARQVSDWTQARSVAEALKTETFMYLVRAGGRPTAEQVRGLVNESDRIEADAAALLQHTAGLTPQPRALPAVTNIASYIDERVTQQVLGFYRPKASVLRIRLQWARRAEVALGAIAAILAAAAGAFRLPSVGAWVAVVSTVAAALTAHVAAQRYEFLLIEYLRTAAELERLRDHRSLLRGPAGAPLTDEEFVRRCEQVVSSQNDRWMAKWGTHNTGSD